MNSFAYGTSGVFGVLAFLAAIALTIILCIKILPAKNDGKFSSKIGQTIHNYFNFKKLYLESILKILFTFLTILCVCSGLFTATFVAFFQFVALLADDLGSYALRSLFSNFFSGILLAVLGPIILRLFYEAIMMFILLVKNVIDINNKIKAPDATKEEIVAEEISAEE